MSFWSVEDEYALREQQKLERENKVNSKFKEGDEVVLCNLEDDIDTRCLGLTNGLKGVVVNRLVGGLRPVVVMLFRDNCEYNFKEGELVLLSEYSISVKTHELPALNINKPIKSDGGSSSYYFTKLPEDLIKQIVETGGIEIKDIVRYCFDNDADCKDIIKALKRIREYLKGGGKEGVDAMYDANKIEFFAKELKEWLKIISKESEE